MSMKIVESHFGKVMDLEAAGGHSWRRPAALYLLAGIVFFWLVATAFLIRDPEMGWVTKIILFLFGTILARVLAVIVESLLTPRSGAPKLRFDRSAGEVTLTRHSVFRRPKPQKNQLADLSRLRLRATASPSFSLGALLSGAKAARRDGAINAERIANETVSAMPLEFRLSMVSDSTNSETTREELTMAVEGVTSEVEAIVLAFKLAAVSGLLFQRVYTLPQVGFEIQLSKQESPGFDRLPKAEDQLLPLAERSLESAGPPPFDPESFQADHQITEWSPGQSVVLERFPPRARFLALPLTPLVLVPVAMLLATANDSLRFNTVGVVVLSGLGLIIGGIAIAIVRIPHRRVEIDWSHRNLVVTRRSKRDVMPFDELDMLELEGVAQEGGGDSGGSWSYWCNLKAIRRNGGGKTPAPVTLLSTLHTRKSDEPWRQATPLLEALSSALGVEGETIDYKH